METIYKTISSFSSLTMDAAKPEQLDLTKNVYSDKTTESRDCDWLRNSANRKPGDSVRGVKRKVADSEIIGGIKNRGNGGDPNQKTNDYIMLCIRSNMSVNYQHL